MGCKGFRFRVTPLRGLNSWTNETQVLQNPSLEWASWLMGLMGSSKALSEEVHDENILKALVRYLRSPGAPFKERIVSLTTQLCKEPHLFSDQPNLFELQGMAN